MSFFGMLFGLFLIALPASEIWAAPMTIQEAVRMALERNPDVRAARETLSQQEAAKDLAVAQLLPVVNGVLTGAMQKNAASGSSTAFSGQPFNQYTAMLQLTQPLTFYPGGAIYAGLDYAKKNIEAARFAVDIAEREVTVNVIQSFYTVLLNKRLFEILQESEKAQSKSVATTKRYYKIGRTELIDVLQADTQLALLEPQLTQAENVMKVAASQLATLLRETGTGELEIKGDLEAMSPAAIADQLNGPKNLVAEVLRNRILLSQFEDTKDVTLAPHLPQLNLNASVGQTAYVKTELLDPYSTSWQVQLQLVIPLFSGLSSVQARKQLAAQGAALQAADDKLLDTTSFNLIQARKNLESAAKVLESSRLAAELADKSVKEAERKYGLNTIDLLKLLTSEQSQLTAQSSFMQAKFNFILSAVRYYVAAGLPVSDCVKMLGRTPST